MRFCPEGQKQTPMGPVPEKVSSAKQETNFPHISAAISLNFH
jgi:hypothetical protein